MCLHPKVQLAAVFEVFLTWLDVDASGVHHTVEHVARRTNRGVSGTFFPFLLHFRHDVNAIGKPVMCGLGDDAVVAVCDGVFTLASQQSGLVLQTHAGANIGTQWLAGRGHEQCHSTKWLGFILQDAAGIKC